MIGLQETGSSLAGMGARAVTQQHANGLDQAMQAARAGKPDEAASAFSSIFSSMLVKEMRSSLSGGFFGEGAGADTYGAWLDEHLGRSLAETDALGLGQMIRVSMGRKEAQEQEAASAAGETR